MPNESTTKPINNQQSTMLSALKSQPAATELGIAFRLAGTFSELWRWT
jgi:hypothetical protein